MSPDDNKDAVVDSFNDGACQCDLISFTFRCVPDSIHKMSLNITPTFSDPKS